MLSPSNSQTEQLKKRLANLPEEKVNLDLMKSEDSNIRKYTMPEFKSIYRGGTGDPLDWHESSMLIGGVILLPKTKIKNLPPIQRNLYYSADEIDGGMYFSFFRIRESLCHGEPELLYRTSSLAKIYLSVGEALTRYPDGSNSLCLCSINNTGERDYQLGTALVQVAIEFSLKIGLEGKINLMQARDSQDFYMKLGFVQKDINNNAWYLPEEAIALWKERIAKAPLLTQLPLAIITQNKQKLNLVLDAEDEEEKPTPSQVSSGWFNGIFCCRKKPKATITADVQSDVSPLIKKSK